MGRGVMGCASDCARLHVAPPRRTNTASENSSVLPKDIRNGRDVGVFIKWGKCKRPKDFVSNAYSTALRAGPKMTGDVVGDCRGGFHSVSQWEPGRRGGGSTKDICLLWSEFQQMA